ncbi:MAG: VWA domain-containing protein [Acidobacteria bacterium]|nr:MAG: VWA domain-containing protein [Acidobacteriota bacterium]
MAIGRTAGEEAVRALPKGCPMLDSTHCRFMFTVLVVAMIVATGLVPRAAAADSGESRSSRVEMDDATLQALLTLHHTETQKVRLVMLPTTVFDRRGRFVRGLDADDFSLFENTEPQSIRYFSSDTSEPVSIAFMLDLSGSMRQMDKLMHAKEAIRFFVDALEAEDQFALIGFADQQVAWITDFTHDRERFLLRLSVQEAYGQTALHDAVAAAPGLVDERLAGRKAIVLITDGVDNFSRLDPQVALELARRVDVPIYAIGFMSVDPAHLPKSVVKTNFETLNTIATETGGRVFAVHDPAELKEAINTIDDELRFQYLIGYYPSAMGSEGEFRRVQLEVGKRLAVRTRSGYYTKP